MPVEAIVKAVRDGVKPSGFHNTGTVLIMDHPAPGLDSKDSKWGLKLLGRTTAPDPELRGAGTGAVTRRIARIRPEGKMAHDDLVCPPPGQPTRCAETAAGIGLT